MTEQFGLFDAPPPVPVEGARSRRARECRPGSRSLARDPGGSPARAHELLVDVQEGRYALLDTTDRVVRVSGEGRVRHASADDESVIVSLLASRFVAEAPAREATVVRHGAVTRPITPLRLTSAGRQLVSRWSALHRLPDASTDGGDR